MITLPVDLSHFIVVLQRSICFPTPLTLLPSCCHKSTPHGTRHGANILHYSSASIDPNLQITAGMCATRESTQARTIVTKGRVEAGGRPWTSTRWHNCIVCGILYSISRTSIQQFLSSVERESFRSSLRHEWSRIGSEPNAGDQSVMAMRYRLPRSVAPVNGNKNAHECHDQVHQAIIGCLHSRTSWCLQRGSRLDCALTFSISWSYTAVERSGSHVSRGSTFYLRREGICQCHDHWMAMEPRFFWVNYQNSFQRLFSVYLKQQAKIYSQIFLIYV